MLDPTRIIKKYGIWRWNTFRVGAALARLENADSFANIIYSIS